MDAGRGGDRIVPRGRNVTQADRERVWTMVERGCRDIQMVAHQVDLGTVTVREIVYDACGELMRRIRREKNAAQIADLEDRA